MPRYEYVKGFEQNDILLPNTWIVVRIDGRGFHKYECSLLSFLSPPLSHSLSILLPLLESRISGVWSDWRWDGFLAVCEKREACSSDSERIGSQLNTPLRNQMIGGRSIS